MRKQNRWVVVLAAALGLEALLGLSTSAVRAQGTDDQRTSCYGDALRLCSAYVPDERAIEACLEGNKPNLSPACFAQFDTPAALPPKARVRR